MESNSRERQESLRSPRDPPKSILAAFWLHLFVLLFDVYVVLLFDVYVVFMFMLFVVVLF